MGKAFLSLTTTDTTDAQFAAVLEVQLLIGHTQIHIQTDTCVCAFGAYALRQKPAAKPYN